MAQALVSAVSKVTAPAANAQLASVANVPQGMVRVDVYASFTATAPAAADAANLTLRLGGVALWDVPVDPVLNNPQLFSYVIQVSAAATVDLIAKGAGTAAVVYQTQIVCTAI